MRSCRCLIGTATVSSTGTSSAAAAAWPRACSWRWSSSRRRRAMSLMMMTNEKKVLSHQARPEGSLFPRRRLYVVTAVEVHMSPRLLRRLPWLRRRRPCHRLPLLLLRHRHPRAFGNAPRVPSSIETALLVRHVGLQEEAVAVHRRQHPSLALFQFPHQHQHRLLRQHGLLLLPPQPPPRKHSAC